ncbi:MAG TPA: hypothetical protein VNL34_04575 [Candidatus Nitrosotenuis sp.]|nr:hypothetical protein [Candidatus Nitrosotenuis sp.]
MKRLFETRLNYPKLMLASNFVVSLGIILVTSGGSWDITNHILNKPETFFAPPHAVLYSGVGIALSGFAALFFSWNKSSRPQNFKKGVTMCGIGIAFLLAAGPADFVWHSNFGLDGLLSPPHLVLISGMILASVGALMNAKHITESQKSVRLFTVISLIPVWFSLTGLFYSFSLPFSETDYFDFNPHPVFAAFFAAAAYPFLISTILVFAAILSRRFGVASIVGASYIGMMSLTAIIPNDSLVHTIPFYLSNMIPIVLGDLMISKTKHTKGMYLAGAVFASASFFMYYPLITYTYNEVLLHKVVWPSLTSQIYFELVPVVSPILVFVGALAGIFGARLAQKMASK